MKTRTKHTGGKRKPRINPRTLCGDICFIVATILLVIAMFQKVYDLDILKLDSYILLLIAIVLGIIGSICLLSKKNWRV